jgi:hypothetical protein
MRANITEDKKETRSNALNDVRKNDYLHNHSAIIIHNHSAIIKPKMQSTISGKDFNDRLANDSTFPFYKKELVKLTVENNIHNNFEFNEGLNVDTIPFNASGTCKSGGFYFTFSNCWSEWLNYRNEFMYWMWDVKIPDDALVYLESETKIKADKFILENKRCIYDEKERCMLAVRQDGNTIRFIKDPSETVQLEAVRQNGDAIQFIEDPSEAVQLEAVRRNGSAIQFIKDPSEAVQLEAVSQNVYTIQYIKDPSELVQLEAARQDGWSIQYIKDPSEEMKLEAARQDGWSIQFIKDPSERVKLEAVRRDGWTIRFIKDPSEEVQLEAVRCYGYVIQFIKDPSETVRLEAARCDG